MTARRGGEAAPPKGRGQAPPPARTPTFVDVAEDMQPRLDAPLHGVEQLHAAHALHLLGDPVQEACAGETMGGKHSGRWPRRGQAAASAASEARRSRTHEASPAAGPPQPCPASAVSGGPAWGRAATPTLWATQSAMLMRAQSGPSTWGGGRPIAVSPQTTRAQMASRTASPRPGPEGDRRGPRAASSRAEPGNKTSTF